MRKLLLLALLCFAPSAFAQNYTATQGAGTTFGAKLVTSVLYPQVLMCDPTTPANCLSISAGGVASVVDANLTNGNAQVQGNVANAATDAGNPVKVGGVYNTTLPILTAAQRGDNQLDPSGNLRVRLYGSLVTGADGVSNASLVSSGQGSDLAAATTLRPFTMGGYIYNATTWDRARSVVGDAQGGTGLQANVPMVWNGTNYDRLKGTAGAPNVGVTTWGGSTITCTLTAYGTAPTGNCPGFNAFVTNATPGIANNADGIAATAASATSPVPVNSYNYAFNGTTWDRFPIVAKSAAPTTAGNQALVVDLRPDSPGIITLGPASVANSVPQTYSSQYPTNNVTTTPTAVTASATGTTAATAATIAATASVTNYVCGFTITADATALATGTAVLSGTISGSLSYLQTIVAVTSGASVLTQNFNPCIPASAANTAIVITSAAAGTGGNTIVNIWGYRL